MANNSWIDIPVVQTIEYFTGVMSQFYSWSSHYALVIGIIGLSWSAFRLANSRFTVRDLWWDTLTKWTGFLLLMTAYPLLVSGVAMVGNRIGIEVGHAKEDILTSLVTMRNSIDHDLKVEQQWADGLEIELETEFDNFTLKADFAESETYSEYIDTVMAEIDGYAHFSSSSDKKKAQHIVNEFKNKDKFRSMFSGTTLKALNSILVTKNIDGSDGDTVTGAYVDLDIWLKDGDGNDSYYLSAGAVFRVALLGCQVMWERQKFKVDVANDDINASSDMFVTKGIQKIEVYLSQIPENLMVMASCVVLLLSVIFALIQYVMAIIEFTIVSSLGAGMIPLILFDGTKDIPKKLVPVLTAFLIKMMVMTTCLMFVFWLLIQQTANIISDDGGVNWVYIGGQIFNALLCFVLTQNAPKIAETLLTGQPQLSMGEFVQAAATAGAVGKKGYSAAKKGAQKTAQTGVNVAGSINKARHAGAEAKKQAKAQGWSDKEVRQARNAGMRASFVGDAKAALSRKGENFMHGGKGGAGAGGGGGSAANRPDGQGVGAEYGGKTLSTTSNAQFQSATKYDERTNSQRNMTTKEFMAEKGDQGTVVGIAAFDKMKAQKAKEAAKNNGNEGGSAPLPDNLTGGSRQND